MATLPEFVPGLMAGGINVFATTFGNRRLSIKGVGFPLICNHNSIHPVQSKRVNHSNAHTCIITLLTTLAISLTLLSMAWNVADYEYVDDCDPSSDGSYRSYWGDDSRTCHDFAQGDVSATCRQFHNGGAKWEDCTSEIKISASVVVTDTNACEFFTDTSCRGLSKVVRASDCTEGAFKSFACESLQPYQNIN